MWPAFAQGFGAAVFILRCASNEEWWRRRESNPRPGNLPKRCLQAQPLHFTPPRPLPEGQAPGEGVFALPDAQRQAPGSASPVRSRRDAPGGTSRPAGLSTPAPPRPAGGRQTRCLIRQRVRIQHSHLVFGSTCFTRVMEPRPAAPSVTNPVETLTPPPQEEGNGEFSAAGGFPTIAALTFQIKTIRPTGGRSKDQTARLHGQWPTDNEKPRTSCPLSVASCQLPVVSCQLPLARLSAVLSPKFRSRLALLCRPWAEALTTLVRPRWAGSARVPHIPFCRDQFATWLCDTGPRPARLSR